jgi:hypothetical protein
MEINMQLTKIRTLINLSTVCFGALLLAGCATRTQNPQATSARNPANPNAPESAAKLLEPSLMASAGALMTPTSATNESGAGEHTHHHEQAKPDEKPQTQNPDSSAVQAPAAAAAGAATGTKDLFYSCPHHPQIKQDHPGECPKCGMKLIKKSPTVKGTP